MCETINKKILFQKPTLFFRFITETEVISCWIQIFDSQNFATTKIISKVKEQKINITSHVYNYDVFLMRLLCFQTYNRLVSANDSTWRQIHWEKHTQKPPKIHWRRRDLLIYDKNFICLKPSNFRLHFQASISGLGRHDHVLQFIPPDFTSVCFVFSLFSLPMCKKKMRKNVRNFWLRRNTKNNDSFKFVHFLCVFLSHQHVISSKV
jgi:hypothetical protein